MAILAAIGVGTVVAVSGLGVAGFGGIGSQPSQPPAVLEFDSTSPRCSEDVMVNSSTEVEADGADTEITYARNVSLPGPSYAIGGPRLERLNDTAYVLDIPFEETETVNRECAGVVRYNGTVRIPAGEDPWQLFIEHDGDRVTRLTGDTNRSIFGGSSQVGQSVSGSETPQNSTTPSE